MEKSIAKDLLSIGAVFLRPEQPFTWASGIKSPIYCDNRLTLTAPVVRGHVEAGLAGIVRTKFPGAEVLMGTSTAGIAHAAITATILDLPMGYVRSGSKDHGRGNRIEGKLEKGQKVVVIEDLISTAGSCIEVVEALREAGAEAACALVAPSWERIAEFIRRGERSVTLTRRTAETQITLTLDLDGRSGAGRIATGIGFFDHMLAQIAHHGGVALSVEATGDLWVDEHHTVEDVGIVLGEAVDRALGSKAGIARYGFVLPMDDCRAMALIDFGGRIGFEWEAEFRRERIGELPTEMLRHFFHSFACAARCNLHVAARGDNEHHKAEAIFKAFARALRMAVARIPFAYDIPSSKGVL